jgi:hypothetical protein
MYQGPGLASGRVRALREGTVVILVRDEEPVEADGYTWLKIRDRKRNVGWIPAQFLSNLTRSPS